MKQKDYKIAEEVKRRLSEAVDLIDIRVYGSRARGDAEDEYSDMDMFIEVENLDKDVREKIREIVWETGFNHSIHISPLIFTRAEIEESPMKSSPIVRCIQEEGVAV